MEQYLKAKQRAKKVLHNKNASDFEIIEYLENEIDYYRNKIKKMQEATNDQTKTTIEEYYENENLIYKYVKKEEVLC